MARQEFIDAVRGASFEAEDGRKIVHCFAGFIGADWDEAQIIALIEGADAVGWIDHIFDHDLCVVKDGRTRCFAVKAPELASGVERAKAVQP